MIAISGLTKRYGDVLAVDDMSLEVPEGSVCGLLGRNGAGKTTAFKCLVGFARPDAGEVRFDGAPLDPHTFAKLGYVPERPELYRWLTVAQHLEFARRSQPAYDDARAKELVQAGRFRLDLQRQGSERLEDASLAARWLGRKEWNPNWPRNGNEFSLQRCGRHSECSHSG